MPLYEYQCKQCGRRTEKIQKFSDPELTVCPHCNGPLERTLTAAAVQFKGGGWYKDLYSSAKPAGASSGGEKPAASTGGETAAKPADSTASSGGSSATPSAPAAASTPATNSTSKG